MAEFSGIPPLGINSIVRPAPAPPPPAVPGVEAGLKGGGLSGRMASHARQPVPGRASPQPEPAKAEPGRRDADPGQLAGPSPAFQASVLELELDLQNTIARVEAARGKRESDIAGVTTGGPMTDDAMPEATNAGRTDAATAPPDGGDRDAADLGPADAVNDAGEAARATETEAG